MIIYRSFFLFIVLFIFSGCVNSPINKKTEINKKKYFSSKGFALIYEQSLYQDGIISKKLNNDKIIVMHSFLKPYTAIKITNPTNSKSLIAKVNSKANYPKIFNSVISEKIASILSISKSDPYVEIVEIKKNKTFVAKHAKIFDEERMVFTKAPVDDVKMDDLSSNNSSEITKKKRKNTTYTLIISDFYYLESANNLMNDLKIKTNINNFKVIKLKDNQYRLSAGPFKNFNTLKSSYISLNILGFENLNITKSRI